ncbi:hypothetical protein AURDEDRAFT_117553 [Auricularia subglabra TFB-10046 SS5]|uniref:Uncharacterized protein n=1 Tax=Auricularia subglabra (strain TFB-10046 / SS5) TaxID=717982 RepID=J0D784_AURST|nr:hypothetical protein AURDEDRAFT_117553 [Auricularia subglabra TFB-10046 SS5]
MAAAPLPPPQERNADELRAAALLTLKAKRKRGPEPVPLQSLPAAGRPLSVSGPDSSTPKLNYDDEPLPTPPASALPGLADKEDGEISEAEAAAGPGHKSVAIVPLALAPPPAAPRASSSGENGARTIVLDQPTPHALPDPAALARSLLLPPSPTISRSAAAAAARPAAPQELDLRPLLQIAPETLHEIKLHILDLLGMGVPPEYLVTYGIQPETIAYAFHELNLRLPYNLNLQGKETVLYPEALKERVTIPQTPPPRPPAPRSPVISATTPRTPSGQQFPPLHAGLPPKPTSAVIAAGSPWVSVSTIAQPARAFAPQLAAIPVASTSQLPLQPQPSPVTAAVRLQPSQDLLEMETQKKQELKARRAVLASLKSKKAAALSTNAPASPHLATSSTPSIATAAQSVHPGVHPDLVADFLRTVAGGPEEQAAPVFVRSPDAMDIDSDEDRPTPMQSSSNPAQPSRQPLPPIASTSSAAVTFEPLRPELNGNSRGVKRSRPVAADFDDGSLSSSSVGSSDNGVRAPKRPAIGSSNGRGVQLPHVPDPPPAIRRNSSFSVLNNAWQTSHVINVSDSEDDNDTGPSQPVASGSGSRPAARESVAPPSRPLSVLQKREREIQEMKERIAAAEQKKKVQKALQLPVLSTTSLPAVDELKREVSTPTLADVVLPGRQRSVTAPPAEDDEIPGLPTLDRHHSRRLYTGGAPVPARTPGVEAGLHPSFYRAPFSLHTSGPVMPHTEAGAVRPGAVPRVTRSLDALSPSPSPMRPPAVPGSRLTAGPGQGARASSAPHAGDSDDDLYGEAGSSSGPRHDGSTGPRRREGEAQEGHAKQGTGGEPISPSGRALQAARIGSLAA